MTPGSPADGAGGDRLGGLDPALERLWEKARRSLERTGGSLERTAALDDPSDAERSAIGGLIGRPIKRGTRRVGVPLGAVDEGLRRRTGLSLVEVLEALGGPLRDRPAETARDAQARAALLAVAQGSHLHREPWFAAWAGALRGGGLTRLLRTPERLADAVRVLELIGGGRLLLPALAARATGDTHALDGESPLASLVLSALAVRAGTAAPRDAEERRSLWEAFDVVVDDLSSTVLVLNLAAEGGGLGAWLTGAAEHGTPFRVTLHQLLHHPMTPAGGVVHVCENPAVLREAAAVLGASGLPLVCAEGQPSVAFRELAGRITAAGGLLRYHGDFDWPGVRMAAAMAERHGAAPWRMAASDYLHGLRSLDGARSRPLAGAPSPTPWDPALSEAMETAGTALYEESVLDLLLADLRRPA